MIGAQKAGGVAVAYTGRRFGGVEALEKLCYAAINWVMRR